MRDPAAQALIDDLALLADPQRAAGSLRFFQSGPGQYGEGDRFLGISVPILRQAVRPHLALPASAIDELLASEWHEHRLAALYVMNAAYKAGDAAERQAVYDQYLRSTPRINNWDLVDASAEFIVGPHLDVVGDGILDELAVSPLLWDRRIAIVAPFHRIKRGEGATSLRIAEQLLPDPEPLIHKATGWMLREVGKRCSEPQLLEFLEAHAAAMTATTLTYACERLTSAQRDRFRALRRAG